MSLVVTEEIMHALAEERERIATRQRFAAGARPNRSLRARLAGALVGAGVRIDRQAGRRALDAAAKAWPSYASACHARSRESAQSHHHRQRRKAA